MIKKIEIIYQDQDIVVCHKMPGIPVQTSKARQQDMVSLLRNHLAEQGEDSQIFIVQRLDQPVEGLMVFARTKHAAADLSRQSKERGMGKQYLALAEGRFKQPCGTLEDYMLRDGRDNISSVVSGGMKGAKLAKLSYEVIKAWQPKETPGLISLVRIKLNTGRHHQILVQLAHDGHPLVGDRKYNPNCAQGYLPVALCSVKLAFCHPKDGRVMDFDIEKELKMLGGIPLNTAE